LGSVDRLADEEIRPSAGEAGHEENVPGVFPYPSFGISKNIKSNRLHLFAEIFILNQNASISQPRIVARDLN